MRRLRRKFRSANPSRSSPLRYLLPGAACLLLFAFYWRGLNCWFLTDDLGWLHIGIEAHDGGLPGLLKMLFKPRAQGTLRPWSESVYFWSLYRLFGMNPVPFHLILFLTACGDLLLLYAIVCRLTGSAWAAAGAQVFWLVNPAIGPGLCCASLYNEIQLVFFMLLALWLFMNGRYWFQLTVFIIGLGSLETAVMYPFVASCYAWLYDRARLRLTVPLYLVSAIYAGLHFWIAPTPKTGAYAVSVDSRVLSTLKTYIEMSLGPERLGHFHWTWPVWLITCGTVMMALGVAAAAMAAKRTGALGAAWFLVFLTPFLLIPEHRFEFYLIGPVVGLAMILAGALVSRWRAPAIALAAIYVAVAIPSAWQVTTWYHERSLVARDLVLRVVQFGREHPGKTLLLTGMDTDQFNAAFVRVPFELYGMKDVWLAPGAEANINDRQWTPLFVPKNAKQLLDSGQALMLDVSRSRQLR